MCKCPDPLWSAQEGRPLVMFVAEGQGVAAARAAMQWDPVQAAATQRPVAVVYIAGSPSAAAFMTEWDAWRSSGATIIPVYIQHGAGSSVQRASVERRSIESSIGSIDNECEDCALLPEHDRCAMLIPLSAIPLSQHHHARLYQQRLQLQ
jgi:hypothetical protein